MAHSNHLAPVPLSIGAIGTPRVNATPVSTATASSSPRPTNGNTQSFAQDHWIRYGNLKNVEDAKNTLIEDILSRYDAVVLQCQSLLQEQNDGHNYAPGAGADQPTLQQLSDRILYLQSLMDGNPFVTVIVDGNNMLFDDAFIRDGEQGGRRAAVVLKDELTDWVPKNVEHAPGEFKVMVKVYGDFRGLAKAFIGAGIIDSPQTFGEFTRGFSTLFEFVDIGGGDANARVVDPLKLFLHDYHCHQVIIGGDRQLLDMNVSGEKLKKRVTLLQSIASDTQSAFKTACFPEVFRSSKITLAIADMTPRTGTPASVSSVGNSTLAILPLYERANSRASSITSTDLSGAKTSSWAKLAQSAAPLPQTSVVPRATEQLKQNHNKKGQRIDPPFEFDLEALQRVKKIKMCNMHYLHPDGCKWPAKKCNHRHDYKPTPLELKLLQSVSRETPCHNGVYCDEIVCVYGHRCPYPKATEGSMRGLGCMLGDKCRFPREMHGIKDSVPDREANTGLR